MEKNNKLVTLIISSVVLVILIGILVCIMASNLLPFTLSINDIFSKKDELTKAEANLVSIQKSYETSVSNVETVKKTFDTQKKKYDAISDETIKVIKDAYTTQDYSIEYMWIKLGNYATKNRLSIVLVEPGGTGDINNTQDDATTSSTDNTVTSDTTQTTNSTNTGSTSSSVLKIKITGSYLDISNFIFEVESDSELKFRLDNISMELVSGTTISATFDVKNVTISK